MHRPLEVSKVRTVLVEDVGAMRDEGDVSLCDILLTMSILVDGPASERGYESDDDPMAAQVNALVNVMHSACGLLVNLLDPVENPKVRKFGRDSVAYWCQRISEVVPGD